MKDIVKKVLESGLVDPDIAKMLEHHQLIPAGAAELATKTDLSTKTKEELEAIANDLEAEVDKEHRIKEMTFDLDRLKWPTTVDLRDNNDKFLSTGVPAVVDRMGRYYFQLHEVKEEWLVPGFIVVARVRNLDDGGTFKSVPRPILEAQRLYVDEIPVCWQVTVGQEIKTVVM